jgi:outer membrane protein
MHKVCNKIGILENTESVTDTTETPTFVADSSSQFAYIDVQRINSEYLFYQDVSKEFEKKQKRAEAEYGKKVQDFQVEYESYMKKAQTGAFLSQASQQQQEADLAAQQENLKRLEQDLSIKLQNEMQKLDFQVKDTIMNYLKKFNQKAGYVMILNSVSILDAGKTVDITDTVLATLNKNYKLQKNKTAQ